MSSSAAQRDKQVVEKILAWDKGDNFTPNPDKKQQPEKQNAILQQYLTGKIKLQDINPQEYTKLAEDIFRQLYMLRKAKKGGNYKSEMRLVIKANELVHKLSDAQRSTLSGNGYYNSYFVLIYDEAYRYKQEKNREAGKLIRNAFSLIELFYTKLYLHIKKELAVSDAGQLRNLKKLFDTLNKPLAEYKNRFSTKHWLTPYIILYRLMLFHSGEAKGTEEAYTLKTKDHYAQRVALKNDVMVILYTKHGDPRYNILHECVHFLKQHTLTGGMIREEEAMTTLSSTLMLKRMKINRFGYNVKDASEMAFLAPTYKNGAFLLWHIFSRNTTLPLYMLCLLYQFGHAATKYFVGRILQDKTHIMNNWLIGIDKGEYPSQEINNTTMNLSDVLSENFKNEIESKLPPLSKAESYNVAKDLLKKAEYFK